MTCTKERFLRDVAEHEMTVIRSDGVNRHLRFRKPGTGCMGFDLITWPGFLCYCGDMGTYVFRRLEDMLQFFRSGVGREPDFGYWAEKLEASDRDGVQEFSMDRFKAAVLDRVATCVEDLTPKQRRSIREAIEQDVLCAEDEHEAVAAVRNFRHEAADDLFDDFSDRSMREYTFRFVWCCYALAWAVAKYDAALSAVPPT